MGFGKSDEVTKTVGKSDNTVSSDIRPFFFDPETGLAPRARAASLGAPSTPFAGPFVAQADPRETEALGLAEGIGRQALPLLAEGGASAGELALARLRGDTLDPASNPALAQNIAAAIRPVERQFSELILPELASRAQLFGAGDNIRLPETIRQAGRDVGTTTGDISARMVGENFARESMLRDEALAMLTAGATAGLPAAQLIGGAGAGQRALDALPIQEALAQRAEAEGAAFRPLISEANILSTIPAGSSGTTSDTRTVSGGTPGIGSQIATGLLGGAGMAASLFGGGGAFPGALTNLFGGGGGMPYAAPPVTAARLGRRGPPGYADI